MRPASLHHVGVLAWADPFELLDLALDEVTSLVGGHLSIEESVQVGGNNVNDVAECSTILLPLSERLSGGDGTSVAVLLEVASRFGDEASKLRGRAIAVEGSLVTDDDQLNKVPFCPVDDVPDLLLGAFDASAGDEDTKDELEAVVAGRLANILESVAVSAVDADGAEALALDDGEILGNSAGILATTLRGVRRIGHTPCVAAATESTRSTG